MGVVHKYALLIHTSLFLNLANFMSATNLLLPFLKSLLQKFTAELSVVELLTPLRGQPPRVETGARLPRGEERVDLVDIQAEPSTDLLI